MRLRWQRIDFTMGLRHGVNLRTLKLMNTSDSNPSYSALSRRSFLALSAAIPAALVAQTVLPARGGDAATSQTAPKKYPIGLELYSVRDEVARDLPNTLKTVAGFGYEVVEFYA